MDDAHTPKVSHISQAWPSPSAKRFSSTTRLRQAGPMMNNCKQKREPGLACSRMVGRMVRDFQKQLCNASGPFTCVSGAARDGAVLPTVGIAGGKPSHPKTNQPHAATTAPNMRTARMRSPPDTLLSSFSVRMILQALDGIPGSLDQNTVREPTGSYGQR